MEFELSNKFLAEVDMDLGFVRGFINPLTNTFHGINEFIPAAGFLMELEARQLADLPYAVTPLHGMHEGKFPFCIFVCDPDGKFVDYSVDKVNGREYYLVGTDGKQGERIMQFLRAPDEDDDLIMDSWIKLMGTVGHLPLNGTPPTGYERFFIEVS